MALAQLFRANFAQTEITSTAIDNPLGYAVASTELFDTDSSVRNLCLVWPDGRRAFFNYAYLVAGEFEPNGERNLIKLSFSYHNVALHGYSLQSLFMALFDHLPRIITAIDPRYVLEEDKIKEVVVEIIIQKNDG